MGNYYEYEYYEKEGIAGLQKAEHCASLSEIIYAISDIRLDRSLEDARELMSGIMKEPRRSRTKTSRYADILR